MLHVTAALLVMSYAQSLAKLKSSSQHTSDEAEGIDSARRLLFLVGWLLFDIRSQSFKTHSENGTSDKSPYLRNASKLSIVPYLSLL